eukprot:TCALIF_11424-PA protein Name:"Similar to Efnb1 Ephrin-B1 (Mus musculus)" AED:0.46 eAED:0.46 QI:0/-1/0/1/-1/1/1/0/449
MRTIIFFQDEDIPNVNRITYVSSYDYYRYDSDDHSHPLCFRSLFFRFRIDNTDHIVDVPEGARVNIICPFYTRALTPNESETEQYIIYAVNHEEYATCRIMRAQPRRIAECDNPYKLKYFTISIRSFSPLPGAMQFKPGEDYHFISTSQRGDLHRRVEGACRSNNMKVVFKVNDGKLTTKRPSGPTSGGSNHQDYEHYEGQDEGRDDVADYDADEIESDISDRDVNLDSNAILDREANLQSMKSPGESVQRTSNSDGTRRGIGKNEERGVPLLTQGTAEEEEKREAGEEAESLNEDRSLDMKKKTKNRKDKKRRKKTRKRKGSHIDRERQRKHRIVGSDNSLLNDKPSLDGGPARSSSSTSSSGPFTEVPFPTSWNKEDSSFSGPRRMIEKELSLVEKVNNLMKQKASIRTSSFNGALAQVSPSRQREGWGAAFLSLNLIAPLLLAMLV